MAIEDDCHICGGCYWTGCDKPADYEMDVVLKRHGHVAYDGVVDLCAGHANYAARTNHMNISWKAIEQAISKQAATRT